MRIQGFLVALGLIFVNTGLSVAQQPAVVSTAPQASAAAANPAVATLPWDGSCAGCNDSSSCDWTGLYLGLHGGWGFSRIKRDFNAEGALADAIRDQEVQNRANGGVLGLHAGYNLQVNRLVFGIEGDFDVTGIDRERTVVVPSRIDPARSNSFRADDQINWLASIRGRVGFTGGSSLFYLTGGLAWQGLERQATIEAVTGPGPASVFQGTTVSGTRTGYVLGAGIDYRLSKNWSARTEYLFYQFERSNTDGLNFATGIGERAASVRSGTNNVNVIRIGLTRQF